MSKDEPKKEGETRLVFNGPVHQININSPRGEPQIEKGEGTHSGGIAATEAAGGLFYILHPIADDHYDTKANGVICSTGYDDRSRELRAKVFGGRAPNNPPSTVEIDAAFPTALAIPHAPHFPNWQFNEIPGSVFTEGTANFLVVWQVLNRYTLENVPHTVRYTSKLSYGTWCDLNFASSSSATSEAVQSDHPGLFEISPVADEQHGLSDTNSDVDSALAGISILVREPGSHEDYPAWRSHSGTGGEWILNQMFGPDGKWHATLSFITAGSQEEARVWSSTASWSNSLGGVMVGTGLPEIEVRRGD